MKRAPHTPSNLAPALDGQLPKPGQRIGLLGGSFNPAHEGHQAITIEALTRLKLDQVWWLVSPQNPLKPEAGMAPLEERVAGARELASDPRILATPLESALGTVYTAETVAALTARFPQVSFVWLMGADNLIEFSDWKDWQQIFQTVVIAVFDRPSYSLRALGAKAARRFARHRLAESAAQSLADKTPPAWVFIHQRLNAQSSTEIRSQARQQGERKGHSKPK